MTQRTEPPDLRRHLAQLEREVRQLQRQSSVRPTTQRPKPVDPHDHEIESWPEAALPTTDLWVGRMVRATAPANALFTNYIFYYNGANWRLLYGRRGEATLSANLAVTSGTSSGRLMTVDFGLAPCSVEIAAHLDGAAWRTGAGDAKAKVILWEERSATDLWERKHIHIPCGSLADSTGRPTGAVTWFGNRIGPGSLDAGDTIKFSVQFTSDTGDLTFAGAAGDACKWHLQVRVF